MNIVCAVFTLVSLSVMAANLDLCLPPDVSAADVQTAAERIVFLYAVEAAEVLGKIPAGDVPAVVIRNTPNLAYFNHRDGEIVLAHWAALDEPVRMFFVSLAPSGDPAQASCLFTSLFNGFLVAHEMTHWLQRRCGLDLDRYTSEAMANDVAVAFFMRLEGGEAELVTLREKTAQAIQHLADPTPIEEDPPTYFNAHYAELARDPYQYGYYQFRFIVDSIDRRADLDFEESVGSLCLF